MSPCHHLLPFPPLPRPPSELSPALSHCGTALQSARLESRCHPHPWADASVGLGPPSPSGHPRDKRMSPSPAQAHAHVDGGRVLRKGSKPLRAAQRRREARDTLGTPALRGTRPAMKPNGARGQEKAPLAPHVAAAPRRRGREGAAGLLCPRRAPRLLCRPRWDGVGAALSGPSAQKSTPSLCGVFWALATPTALGSLLFSWRNGDFCAAE